MSASRLASRAVSPARASRPRVVLTIGKFDGVHAGHRHLLSHVLQEADIRGTASAAVVLHPDPRGVLQGEAVPLLSAVEDRAVRLRAFGLDFVEPLTFARTVADLDGEGFVARLTERFDVSAIVTGPDFRFGHGRSGDVRTLERLGHRMGFDVVVVSPLEIGGAWVGSRRLRTMIGEGEVERARSLLRHPCRMVGTVIHGAARGRTLGYPTANLDPVANYMLPADGIYTVRASWLDKGRARMADGVASVGVRPTFDHGERLVEVYLLDFEDDLYGRDLTVDFLVRQRSERRYTSVEALVAQMGRDVRRARRELALEALVDRGLVSSGHQHSAVGRDLAQTAEALADAALATGATCPREGARRRVVSVSAPGAAATLSEWLDLVGRAWTTSMVPVAAQVYYADRNRLMGLLTEAPRARQAVAEAPILTVDRLVHARGRYLASVTRQPPSPAPRPA